MSVRSRRRTNAAIASISARVKTVPTGFHGVLSSSTRVAGVTASSSASTVSVKRPPTIGARTNRGTPPASAIGER